MGFSENKPVDRLMQHDVAEREHQKNSRHQQHQAEQHFIGAGGEFDSLHGHQGDESHGDRSQQRKRNLRHHAMNGQHGIERVLNRLEKILEKHRPSENETHVRIQGLADVGINGS